MQQSTQRLMVVLGGTVLVAGSMLVVACSTDNGGSTSSGALPTIDANVADRAVTPADPDANTTDGGSNPDCGSAPKLQDTTNNDGGIYCPFQGDGGKKTCTATEECCVPGGDMTVPTKYPDSFCAPKATGTNDNAARFASCQANADASASENWNSGNASNSAYECADKTSCASDSICCATTWSGDGGPVNPGKSTAKGVPAACNAEKLYKNGGTRCVAAAACSTSELRMCSLNDPCPSGQTCHPAAASGRYIGYCK